MRISPIAVALALGLIATSASAAGDQKTQCVLRATEALPKLAGLKVARSGTRPMPAEQLANWKGQSKPIIVDIDVGTPDFNERYSYVYASGPTGGTFVQRVVPSR